MEKYKPIDCNFYDILEANAVRRNKVDIQYFNEDNKVVEFQSVIVDLKTTASKEEFIYFSNGISFRLDRLISVDGNELNGFCAIKKA